MSLQRYNFQPLGRNWRPLMAFAADEPVSGPAHSDPARILIVEDEFLAAAVLQEGLAEAGYNVVGVASTADQAISLARSERRLLVIMDIRLIGKRDGVDAALEIFESTGRRCIFATALQDSETRDRAQPASPLGWIAKPYTVKSVIAMIEAVRGELLSE